MSNVKIIHTDAKIPCVYCRQYLPIGELEEIRPGGNLACKDNKACLARQVALEAVSFIDELLTDNPELDRAQVIEAVKNKLEG